MKISLNWLKKYVDVPVTDEELIRTIGARLVEVEGVIDETHKYDNVYVVRVESCERIPDTHLTLCRIDVGREEKVQVVCGAPNVREGMLAVWIAPGAIVPASVHEDAPFEIGKRKMRGYESCGMLAGADELDFDDKHEKIAEIDPAMAKPGDLLADVFELNDLVLEIENKSLTHRPDCFGIVGFAREVAGILGVEFDQSKVENNSEIKVDNAIKVKIENKDICERYSAVVLEKHGELKDKYLTWQDTVISKAGMRPVDPIVDATNYLMLLTGQPLHAFDYDKFVAVGGTDKPEIRVRTARAGEKLMLLDDREVELNENDIAICSGEVPVALAGAMGGKATAIDENTRKVILESATFSLYNLRKTQMSHGIFSEAITRFTKGQSPFQTLAVAEACAKMLAEGFKVVGAVDEYPNPQETIAVRITPERINNLLGTKYDADTIMKTLKNVGFRVRLRDGVVEMLVPAWRTDVHIKEDVIEEVGRLLGYDNIEPTLPLHKTAEPNKMWDLKHVIREAMAKMGANEVLTYSFVSGKVLERVGQDADNSYKIVNSISPELQYVRQSIVPSLLEKTYLNEKLPVERFAIFEMNEVHRKEWGVEAKNVPVAGLALGCVVAERKNKETAFYKAKWYAAKLLEELNIVAEFVPIKDASKAEARPFEPKRTAEIWIGDEYVGVVGEFKNSVKNEFKLAPYVAGFEMDLAVVLAHAGTKKEIRLGERKVEDSTVTTDKTYAETLAEVQEKYPGAKITPGTIYQADGQKTKNITFHIELML